MLSLVIPVYKNEGSLPDLVASLDQLSETLNPNWEVIFVVDGSPDRSAEVLFSLQSKTRFSSKILCHSRNFGSFAAIRTGMQSGNGKYFAVLSADLQEPPELILDFWKILKADEADIVLGTRSDRDDPWLTKLASSIFWSLYRRFVQGNVPPGGIDMFGCSRIVRDELLKLRESNSSLVGLLLWVGFRRETVSYCRRKRLHGKSAWTLRKKLKYFGDSMFSFSDLPIKVLLNLGFSGLFLSLGYSIFILYAKITNWIPVPGYATTVLLIAFFAGLNCLGLGIIGAYVWRTYENTKGRPEAILMSEKKHEPFRSS